MNDRGVHVSANQGGCTAWCDFCGKTVNCESWTEDTTLKWMDDHRKTCEARKDEVRAEIKRLEKQL